MIYSCNSRDKEIISKAKLSENIYPLITDHITLSDSTYIDQYNIANKLYNDNNIKQSMTYLDSIINRSNNYYIIKEAQSLRMKCLLPSIHDDRYAKNLVYKWSLDEFISKSSIEQYYYIKSLIDYASYILNKSEHVNSIIIIDYAIQLIEIIAQPKLTKNIKDQAVVLQAKILLTDNPENQIIVRNKLEKLILESKNPEVKFNGLLIISNISTLTNVEVDEFLSQAYSLLEVLSNRHQEIYYSHLGAILLARNKNNEGRKALIKANSFYPDDVCNKYKSINFLYLSQTYINENADSSTYYLNLANATKNCSRHTSNLINFYSKYIEYEIIKSKNNNTYTPAALKKLINERELSDQVFSEKNTLHEYDYRSQNTNKILLEYYSKSELNDIDKYNIINFVNSTKTLKWKSNFSSEKRLKLFFLEEIRRNRNDFKNERNASTLTINKMNIYINEYILSTKNSSETKEILFKENSISQTPTLEFFQFNNNLWCYLIKKNDIQLELINVNADSINHQFTHLNIYNVIQKLNFLNIINDGISYQILFQVQFPDLKISHSSLSNNNRKSYLSVSNSYIFSYTDKRTYRSLNKKEIPEIINSYHEANSIIEILNSKNKSLGNSCTIENLKSSMSSDILHIATHAYSDTLQRLESYLILRDTFGQPKRFYADEILSMPTVPKFVNLSACQTGTGVHKAGAGTYSIARSFLQKGSEAVLKTLWDVDDQATKEFMATFYTKWKEGLSCGDALYETKKTFRSSVSYSNPKYWAGFILEGNPNLYISMN